MIILKYLIWQTLNLFTCYFQIFFIFFDIYAASLWNHFVKPSQTKPLEYWLGLYWIYTVISGEKMDLFTALKLLSEICIVFVLLLKSLIMFSRNFGIFQIHKSYTYFLRHIAKSTRTTLSSPIATGHRWLVRTWKNVAVPYLRCTVKYKKLPKNHYWFWRLSLKNEWKYLNISLKYWLDVNILDIHWIK